MFGLFVDGLGEEPILGEGVWGGGGGGNVSVEGIERARRHEATTHRILMSAAKVKKACSTLWLFFADVSKNGRWNSSAKAFPVV